MVLERWRLELSVFKFRVAIPERVQTTLATRSWCETKGQARGSDEFSAPTALASLTWLHDRDLWYWGDIDTHGFAILDRLRQVFPHARSTLMDEETLLRHRAHWGREATPVTTELGHLTPAEAQLYEALVAGRHAPALRLEQERIRFGDVQRTLTA
jgi:hypothetical protein